MSSSLSTNYRGISTLRQELIDVVNELKAKYDIVPDKEMDSHAIDTAFFNGELPNYFRIVVLEIQHDTAFWPIRAYEFNFYDFYFCGFVFFKSLLLDVSEESFLVSFQGFVVFILGKGSLTRCSISAKLTLKFSTLTLVLEGS